MPRPHRLPKSAQQKNAKILWKTDQKMTIKIQKFSWPFRITYKLFKSILKISDIFLKIKINFLDLFSYDFFGRPFSRFPPGWAVWADRKLAPRDFREIIEKKCLHQIYAKYNHVSNS